MQRRDFIKTGSLVFTGLATGNLGFSFIPDDFYEKGPYRNRVPHRKPARKIREVVPGFLWADAGDFQDYGGWAFDTQHFGFMGSSYLIAHGAGRPVDPARLTIPAVEAGRYRLWVRSRDWVPVHSPGHFKLSMNGKDAGKAFGASGRDGWVWEDGGVHELGAGKLMIEMRDLTGFFGRCSSLILTRELDYEPPGEMEAFRAERARLSGHSNKLVTKPGHEVVIVGGGSAGCCAAIAAARMGVKVALITDRPLLGGNGSVELGVPVVGAAKFHSYARETGIIEEAGRLGLAKNWGHQVMSRQFAALIDEEPNLKVYTDLFLEGVEKDGSSRIRAALARNVLTGEPFRFPGKMFIDTSGDAWLGYHAGADYRFGREARHEYNESRAPEKADTITMSGCLRGPHSDFKRCMFLRTREAETPQPFDPPAWIYQDMPPYEEWSVGRQDEKMFSWARQGNWWLEHPGWVDDLNKPEEARDELIRTIYSFWHMVKNKWPERERIAHFELDYVPFMVGKRETRRLVGDHMLNQNDVMAPTHFKDGIGHSGWNLDVHHPQGILSKEGAFDYHDVLPLSEIPYRSLYSRNIDNLLMAGRNASVTHVAMGTTRVQGQTCVMGQAAGTAAALAVVKGLTPRGIYESHIGTLQQTLLKHDHFIVKVPNADPDDLARTAWVSASSYHKGDVVNPFRKMENVREADWLALNVPRGVLLPWRAGTPLEKVALRLRSPGGGEAQLKVLGLASPADIVGAEELARQTVTIVPGTQGWVELDLSLIPQTENLALVLTRSDSVEWARAASGLPGIRRFYEAGRDWQAIEGSVMQFDVTPSLAFPRTEANPPQQVINGIARPTFPTPFASLHPEFHHIEPDWVKGNPLPAMNCWQSAKDQPLPQWIELSWEEPQVISAVHCVFDTHLNMSIAHQWDAFPDVCVRGYRIECEVDGMWQRVAGARLNFQRFRKHRFKPVKTRKVRLTVVSTHGAPFARLFEIRAYRRDTPFVS